MFDVKLSSNESGIQATDRVKIENFFRVNNGDLDYKYYACFEIFLCMLYHNISTGCFF